MHSKSSFSVLIVDDHSIIRDGIKAMLADCDEIQSIDEVSSADEAIKLLDRKSFDIILLDISMEGLNGLDATSIISNKYQNSNVLILTMHEEEEYFNRAINSGAKGYILKNSNRDDLIKAITLVSQGKNYFSNEVYSSLIMNKVGSKKEASDSGTQLTKREKIVLELIAEEMTNHEIAEKLFISPRTVDTHRRNLLQKLEVKNTAGLVKYAMLNGYVHS